MSAKPQQKVSGWTTFWIIMAVIAASVVLGGVESGWFSSDDNDTTVPAPTAQDTADLARRLAEADKAHGICYGWELRENTYSTNDADVVAAGSSRGDIKAAEACNQYVILEVGVDYTSASSESEDSASIYVRSDNVRREPSTTDLERYGITRDAALADPAATVGLGALALPLIMVELGEAEPLPPTTSAAEPATPIGHPGSDFLGANKSTLIALGVLGGLALFCLLIGLLIRKRGKEAR